MLWGVLAIALLRLTIESVRTSAIDECKVVNVDTVPGSSVVKGLEKPSCGPLLSFTKFCGASFDHSASKLHVTSLGPTRPLSTNVLKGPATPSETLSAVPFSVPLATFLFLSAARYLWDPMGNRF